MRWIHENPPHWDESKAAIVGAAPPGALKVPDYAIGELIAGEWWRVERDRGVVGYGWIDAIWGDAEILLVVADGERRRGVGTFILDHLEIEAAARGLNYLYNVVPATHPDREEMTHWLENRRFELSDDDRYVRRVVRPLKR